MLPRFHDDFVRALPGEPDHGTASRQVHGACYSRVQPTRVASPSLLAWVPEVATLVGLDAAPPGRELVDVLAGNLVTVDMAPYAACYGGHQFGTWAGQLGDGRVIGLGELGDTPGARHEVQLKGAGPTPYSRRGDGRAVLRSSLRELVASEAMHHLGVPTTRALALVGTGEAVMRDMFYDGRAAPEPGAIAVRVAPSFLRFGSFELHAARGDVDTLRTLVSFACARYFPALATSGPGGGPDVVGLLAEVARRTARTIAGWMRVGFVHGVMNTDNMSLLGLTIDYGPFGWLEPYDPDWTPNTTDAGTRRYRFGNQPQVGYWNVLALGKALGVLEADGAALARAAGEYRDAFEDAHRAAVMAKLGLTAPAAGAGVSDEDDDDLLGALQAAMTQVETDLTLFFRGLADVPLVGSDDARLAAVAPAFYDASALDRGKAAIVAGWLARYAARRAREADDAAVVVRMHATNPLYVPRNFLLQEAIDAATAGDLAPLGTLLEVLRRPYTPQPGREAYAARRPEWARQRAGCSMLSCSS